MAIVVSQGSTTRKRNVIYAMTAAAVVLLLVAGLAFANSLSVTRVTNNARSLHWNNAVIGTSALMRAGLAQAVTFSELREDAQVTDDDVAFAMDQVEMSFAELEHLLEIGGQHSSYPAVARYFGSVEVAMEALRGGDVDDARETIVGPLETSYAELEEALADEQMSVQRAIEDNSASGRALNAWVVFFLTLAVPGSAVAVYFVIARRQIRAFRERTQIELEAEREVSRAKDAFIAGLSHELRTPLTSIYGFAEILADGDIKGAEATRETAQIIANESAEMTRMVDDLLAASRLDSVGLELEMASTRVDDVVESAIAPFEKTGVSIEREPTHALIDTDASRLRHVLVNLLSNAARHGGPRVWVEVTSDGKTVDIEVVDNGPGVPEQLEGTLFERFPHEDRAPLLTGSVGLGLAVAYRVTELIGGELRYQRYGGRTYFVVTLPAASIAGESVIEGETVADMIRALSS